MSSLGVGDLQVMPYCPTTLYDILGLRPDGNVSSQDIKDMYRNLAKEFHPDKHVDKKPEEKDNLESQFNEINRAYKILSNEDLRERYDQGSWEYIDSQRS